MPFPIPKPPATISKFFSMGNGVPVTACPILPAPKSISSPKDSMRQKTVSVITEQSNKTDAVAVNAKIIKSLIRAISLNDEKKVGELLAQNPNLNSWNEKGYTPLASTAYYNNEKMAQKLLNTPNINIDLPNKTSKWTPIAIAAQMGKVEVLKLLVSYGATKTKALEYAKKKLEKLKREKSSAPQEIMRFKTIVKLLTKKNSTDRFKILSQAVERGLGGLSSLSLHDIPDAQEEDNESITTTPSQAGAGAGRGP